MHDLMKEHDAPRQHVWQQGSFDVLGLKLRQLRWMRVLDTANGDEFGASDVNSVCDEGPSSACRVSTSHCTWVVIQRVVHGVLELGWLPI